METKNGPCGESVKKWEAIPKSLYDELVIFQVGRGSILPLGMEITIDKLMFCSNCGWATTICNCIKIDAVSNTKGGD